MAGGLERTGEVAAGGGMVGSAAMVVVLGWWRVSG